MHEDPQKVALALKLQERYPTDPESPGGVPHVLRTGRPEIYPEVTDEMLEAAARDEEHLELLRDPELVESLVQRNRAMARGQEISLKIEGGFPSSSLGDVGAQLLRIIQEALTNARRHSGARSVVVTPGMEGSDLVAEVSDDGLGFRPRTASGVGMSSMRERASAIGAKLEVGSEVGQGARVRLRVPVPQKG